jgi:DNA-binding PadR family transcriptional regulator
MPKSREQAKPKDLDLERFAQPHGAPRGLLIHYILFKIASKPSHGYELLQDIEEKTQGAWRPGAGSVYPLLKKLVSSGYIQSESSRRVNTAQHVYHITPKGKKHVEEARKIFSNANQRWGFMARIFTDMISPKDLSRFCIDGSRMQFDVAREAIESKIEGISPSEAEFMLKEYTLNLQRQLDWTSTMLQKLPKAEQISVPTRLSANREEKLRIASRKVN